jgi:beta-lactamase superfamily II metal-dependent hydrolase
MLKLPFMMIVCSIISLYASQLKIYYLDVSNGDCEIICSPDGKNILIDAGSIYPTQKCPDIIKFCDSNGISKFDYAIISHYDSDHIACFPDLKDRLNSCVIYDRGDINNKKSKTKGPFYNYIKTIKDKRKTASKGDKIILDNGKLKIEIVALNGNDVPEADDENDLSLVAVLHYGKFDATFGGDLSGYDASQYKDIETSVAPLVKRVEVYKAHHHCSANSTNETWLNITQPQIAILSVGPYEKFKHPSEECVNRLHNGSINVECFWTEEGIGATPGLNDHVWGNITIEVDKEGGSYTVKGSEDSITFNSWPDPPENDLSTAGENNSTSNGPISSSKFAWSVKGEYYHTINCPKTKTIAQGNLRTGDTLPAGKNKHSCVE